jgi:hypothetical protein
MAITTLPAKPGQAARAATLPARPGQTAPAMALVRVSAPNIVRSGVQPAAPKGGGRYVGIGGGNWRLQGATGTGPAKPAAAPGPYANPLYQPGAVLSGKQLADAATALTNLKYDPVINALNAQIAQNTKQGAAAQQATAGYFNQLGQYAQQSAQNVRDIGAGLNTQLQQIGQGTQAALDQFGQRAVTPYLQSLTAQGLGGGASDQLAAALASQRSLAAQNAAANQAFGAKVGSDAATLAAQNLGTYALRGQERLGEITQATRLAQQPLETQLGTQRVAKGQAYATNLGALRQQQFANWVAQQGLGLKSAAITAANQRTQAQINAANRRAAAAQTGATQRAQMNIDARAIQGNLNRQARQQIASQADATRKAIAAGRTSAAAGKPASPAAQRVMWNEITRVQGRIRDLTAAISRFPGATRTGPKSIGRQVFRALNQGIIWAPPDPNAKSKALQSWHWAHVPVVGDQGLLTAAFHSLSGGLMPADVAYLHNMGFTIGSRMPIQGPRGGTPNAPTRGGLF